MTELNSNPRATVSEHLKILQSYAKKCIIRGEDLTDAEYEDKETRIKESVAIGVAFRLTYRDMVKLIFKDILKEPKNCGCPTCRARQQKREQGR